MTFTPAVIAVGVIQLCIALAAAGLMLFCFRWLSHQSRAVGWIVAAGILARAVLGQTLFWVSYLHLPILSRLQLGNGFWALASDAKAYYGHAADAATSTLIGMDPGRASPFFVQTLAVWMRLVGVSPAAGLFLNLFVYVVLCVIVVAVCRPRDEWKQDLPCLVSVAAFSFSPVLMIHSTQPLKEDLFGLLVVVLCLAMSVLLPQVVYGSGVARRSHFYMGLLVAFAANYGVAGIRPYFAVMVPAAATFVLTVLAVRGRARPLGQYAVGAAVVLAVLGSAYWQGIGAANPEPERSRLQAPSTPLEMLDRLRNNYIRTGGRTSIASRFDTVDGTSGTVAGRANALIVGLGAVFIPVTLLQALSVVGFSGGRGLLPIADADTIFMDVMTLWMLTLLYTRRDVMERRLPMVLFTLTLSALSACLLGYVVTNFGSLFRIKSMVAIPIWVLCVAISRDANQQPLQHRTRTA